MSVSSFGKCRPSPEGDDLNNIQVGGFGVLQAFSYMWQEGDFDA